MMDSQTEVEVCCRAIAFLWGWDVGRDPMQILRKRDGRFYVTRMVGRNLFEHINCSERAADAYLEQKLKPEQVMFIQAAKGVATDLTKALNLERVSTC